MQRRIEVLQQTHVPLDHGCPALNTDFALNTSLLWRGVGSRRSLNALEDSVRASLKREGSTTTNQGEDSSQDLFGAQPPGLDSR